MNVSIVIPQIFYDFIARIIPGLIFLLALSLGYPALSNYIYLNGSSYVDNFIISLGQGVGYAILSYFVGWLFSAFVFASKREKIHDEINGEDPKSLEVKYQWIRLSHAEAGFRIVKLRAEARMVEATRIAMLALIIISFIYLAYSFRLDHTIQVSLTRSITVIILATISAFACIMLERKVWEYYWGNIQSIYKILHDKDDPVIASPNNLNKT